MGEHKDGYLGTLVSTWLGIQKRPNPAGALSGKAEWGDAHGIVLHGLRPAILGPCMAGILSHTHTRTHFVS